MALRMVLEKSLSGKICIVGEPSFLREIYVELKSLDENELRSGHDPGDDMFDPALVLVPDSVMEVSVLESSVRNGMFFVQHVQTFSRKHVHKVFVLIPFSHNNNYNINNIFRSLTILLLPSGVLNLEATDLSTQSQAFLRKLMVVDERKCLRLSEWSGRRTVLVENSIEGCLTSGFLLEHTTAMFFPLMMAFESPLHIIRTISEQEAGSRVIVIANLRVLKQVASKTADQIFKGWINNLCVKCRHFTWR